MIALLLVLAANPSAPSIRNNLIVPIVMDEASFPATATATKGGIIFGSDGGVPYWSPGDGGAWQTFGTAAASTGWTSDGGSTATTLRVEVGANGIFIDGGMQLATDIRFITGNTGSNPADPSYNCFNFGPLTGGNQWWLCGKPNVAFKLYNNGTEYMSFSPANGIGSFPFGVTTAGALASTIGSGSVAVQTVSGAKTCTGTSGAACITDGTQNRGVKALSVGTGTVTVFAGAICNCSLNTSAGTAAPKCSVSGTTLTITGSGTDSINYFCY